VAELLAKTTEQGRLDQAVTKEDQEILLEALQSWGALDKNYRYVAGDVSADFRGFAKDPGGGLSALPVPGEPLALSDLLRSRIWSMLASFSLYYFQTTLFQPVGGMDQIGKAFARQVGDLIRYNSKVTEIRQSDRQVTVTYEDVTAPGKALQATADWCLCTIPLPILSQIPIDVGAAMKSAIDAVPYAASVKIGLQFKRRFWEEDEAIYGGISYTDLPIDQIGYPSTGFNRTGKGVLLGAYIWDAPNAYEFTAMPPAERIRRAVKYGAQLHPQYRTEFETGIAVAWHRIPFTLGCASNWDEDVRRAQYNDLCQIDGRLMLAGEHASYLPAWQEGAILSALDAISRLHRRVMAA
jgi:monoamine oxidase